MFGCKLLNSISGSIANKACDMQGDKVERIVFFQPQICA